MTENHKLFGEVVAKSSDMIQEKAEQYFSGPLRVLFFFDASGEFTAEVDGLDSGRFSVLKDAGTPFTTKCGSWSSVRIGCSLPAVGQADVASGAVRLSLPRVDMAHKVLELDDVGVLMEGSSCPLPVVAGGQVQVRVAIRRRQQCRTPVAVGFERGAAAWPDVVLA